MTLNKVSLVRECVAAKVYSLFCYNEHVLFETLQGYFDRQLQNRKWNKTFEN